MEIGIGNQFKTAKTNTASGRLMRKGNAYLKTGTQVNAAEKFIEEGSAAKAGSYDDGPGQMGGTAGLVRYSFSDYVRGVGRTEYYLDIAWFQNVKVEEKSFNGFAIGIGLSNGFKSQQVQFDKYSEEIAKALATSGDAAGTTVDGVKMVWAKRTRTDETTVQSPDGKVTVLGEMTDGKIADISIHVGMAGWDTQDLVFNPQSYYPNEYCLVIGLMAVIFVLALCICLFAAGCIAVGYNVVHHVQNETQDKLQIV